MICQSSPVEIKAKTIAIPKFGQDVPGVGVVGKYLGRRFYKPRPTLETIPPEILGIIYKYLTASDLANLERVSKLQQRVVGSVAWLTYFRQRGFNCLNTETKQQLMNRSMQFGPKQLIRLVGLDRWLRIIQPLNCRSPGATKDESFINFQTMGDRTFTLWSHENRAFFAIRYMSISEHARQQGIVVFCQRIDDPTDWVIKSPCDPADLATILNGPVKWYAQDDWRWQYFGRLVRGLACGTGPQGTIVDEKITLWDAKEWHSVRSV